MAKTIKINAFSSKSIDNAIREIEKYKDSLEFKARLIAERLSEIGVEIARVQIADLDAIFTGELLASIHNEYVTSEKGSAVFSVVANSKYAIFVEMGTGVVGASHPYPGKLPAVYAQGKTIRQLADGRIGWFYKADNGEWYFTEGMPSRPFMYNTARELETKIVSVAREVFKE